MSTLLACFAFTGTVYAQPPAIPQPALIFYGTVARSPGDNPVTPASVTWTITGNGESITAADTTIVVMGSETFYLSRIPFETRRIAGIPDLPATPNSLELPQVDTSYTRGALVGSGGMARPVMLPAGQNSFLYGPARQGLIERLDLVIGETYDEWSQRIFGEVADPNADADGDGRTNHEEFLQGTDPRSATSFSILRSFAPAPGGGFTITWDSIATRRYTIESSPDLGDQNWQPVLPAIRGTGDRLAYTHPIENDSTQFFRIIVSEL